MGIAATVAFVIAGVGYLAQQYWWAIAGVAGAVISIVLMVITFTPWWLFALLLNAVVLAAAWQAVR